MKILYFTSTGNNLYISKQLGGELISIPQLMKERKYDIEDDVVGIVFPVFYANSPKMLREFIEKVNIKADYIFNICSYGSDGDMNALKLMKKTLKKRGINVNYSNSVLMVDNYLPMFDMEKEKEIKQDSDIDKQIEIIKKDIEERKEFMISKKSFSNVPFIERVLEETMTKRFSLVVGDGCDNCRICTMVCPRGNIHLEDKPIMGDNCDFCLGCVHHCKNNVFRINNELNENARYRNSHIKVSEIIKSNNLN